MFFPGSSNQDSNKDTSKQTNITNRPKQRNYKNMTRERRIEANARERQRVQAITEVYETLRGVIPVEDKCSKLSKLSIIRIATGKNHAFKKGLNDFVLIPSS